MYRGLTTAVVVPAFNEEKAIAHAVASIPSFVDRIVVVDDASADRTSWQASAVGHARVEVLVHDRNRGVGAAIVSGYRRALAHGIDVTAVMAGDGQMHPDDLAPLIDPIVEGRADYAKGNRFAHPSIWREMPLSRLFGNVALSFATKITSGYHHIFDSQCGYTAITKRALAELDLESVFPRYGYPNDLLARLHAAGLRVTDVPVRSVYGREWKSGISPRTVAYPISYVLLRSWTERLKHETRTRLTQATTTAPP